MRWIPTSERLPRPLTYVNATCKKEGRENWIIETCYVPLSGTYNPHGYSDWGNIPILNSGEAEVIAWYEREIPEPWDGGKDLKVRFEEANEDEENLLRAIASSKKMDPREARDILAGVVTHYDPFSEESRAICKAIEALEILEDGEREAKHNLWLIDQGKWPQGKGEARNGSEEQD